MTKPRDGENGLVDDRAELAGAKNNRHVE